MTPKRLRRPSKTYTAAKRRKAQVIAYILRSLGRSEGKPSTGPYELPCRVVRPR